jgi:L-ascorbate metabolism protein UlaG (beta-lactamase superfamily)
MQIRAIGHAGVAIHASGQHLLCDPWWNGPAYVGQWQQWPPPRVEPQDRDSVQWIYISHGHEDHLHLPTLRTINKDATLVIPRFRDTGMRDCLGALGFKRILEIGHGERRILAPGFTATMYVNRTDSILSLEAEGRTLVNANDALHSHRRHVVDHLAKQVRKRHPRIDTLLLSYGGASWFPSCMLLTDDLGYDVRDRELVFAEGFAHAARALDPKLVLAFGASHILLDDRLRWVHAARWNGGSPLEELQRQAGSEIRGHILQPGDCILDDDIQAATAGVPSLAEAEAGIDSIYAAEISQLRERLEPERARTEKLLQTLKENAAQRAPRVLPWAHALRCRIDLRDVPEMSFLLEHDGERAIVNRCDRLRLAPLVLSTRMEVLEALAFHQFGFEAITIGYGATLQLRRRDLPLRKALLDILGRKPLPPTRAERVAGWLRSPRRKFDVWRRDLHWKQLAWDVHRGKVNPTNNPYAADPERWSPLREEPLPRQSAGR